MSARYTSLHPNVGYLVYFGGLVCDGLEATLSGVTLVAEVDVFQLLWLNLFSGHVFPTIWLGRADDLLLSASAP